MRGSAGNGEEREPLPHPGRHEWHERGERFLVVFYLPVQFITRFIADFACFLSFDLFVSSRGNARKSLEINGAAFPSLVEDEVLKTSVEI